MTYSAGNIIQASDYNNFAANVNATWSTNYGQTALTTVSTGANITATQWSSLNSTISTMASHQGTAITSRTNPVAGNIITAMANVFIDVTNCVNNTANAVSSGTQYTAWTGNVSQTSPTGVGGNAWTITFTSATTFANATAADNFFNAGGLMKVQFGKTSTGTSADTEWNTFVNTICGTVYLSSTATSKTIANTTYTGTTVIGGSGTPSILAGNIGFAQLTTTPVTIYKQFDSGTAYSSNYVSIQANIDPTHTILTLSTVWFDNGDSSGANISGGTATTGITFGTAPTTLVTYTPPETTYLTNTWGTPTVVGSVA